MHTDANENEASQPVPPEAAVEALYAMGHTLYQQERFADSADVFRILVQIAPDDERGWLALGECHECVGHRLIALELYGAGAAVTPNAMRCELARFRLLHDMDRIAEADEAFETAVLAAEANGDEDFSRQLESERRMRS